MAAEFSYTITDPDGIHARPAGELVKKANEFLSDIKITKDSRSVSAKAIFGVMSLSAKKGDTITFKIEGADEEKAAQELKSFLEANM